MLRQCINSIVLQIEYFGLQERILIFVANDASPDNTTQVLAEFNALNYFKCVTRDQNLGMNMNIKCMLIEAAMNSSYQLIMTDDDYLEPDVLNDIVAFLNVQQKQNNRTPAIWTPRYSYTEDGNLLCVVCNPLRDDSVVNPSPANTGRYMYCGYVLSGLILRAECIDYEFWATYEENAFFPMIFFADLLFRNGGLYWNKNVVHHTVLNECHWERWGRNDVVIGLRLFTDYVNAYDIMAKRLNGFYKILQFYWSSFPSIRNRVDHFLLTERFIGNKNMTMDAIHELKGEGILNFNTQLRLLMVCATTIVMPAIILSIIKMKLGSLILGGQKKERARNRFNAQLRRLRFMPTALKIILSQENVS